MKVKVRHLYRMLSQLADKTGESLDRAGLRNIASRIDGISEDYLYKKIQYAIRSLDDEQELSLRDAQLNSVARFLGFSHISALIGSYERPADEQMRSLTGNYYLYVRQNSSRGLVFQSPVSIFERDTKFIIRMTGPSLTYEGEAQIRQGCLFVLLESPQYKSFYHVYKIGTRHGPHVIQGIFSGVSTALDPIGGRCVLLRVDESLQHMENRAYTVEDLSRSDETAKQKLAVYFRHYSRNNLSINKVVSFSADDLLEE